MLQRLVPLAFGTTCTLGVAGAILDPDADLVIQEQAPLLTSGRLLAVRTYPLEPAPSGATVAPT